MSKTTIDEVVASCNTVIKINERGCDGHCQAGAVCDTCEAQDIVNSQAPDFARALKAAVEWADKFYLPGSVARHDLLDTICKAMTNE